MSDSKCPICLGAVDHSGTPEWCHEVLEIEYFESGAIRRLVKRP